MKKVLVYCFALLALTVSCSPQTTLPADYRVIPLPNSIAAAEGAPFLLKPSTRIYCPPGDQAVATTAGLLAGYIRELTGFKLKVTHRNRPSNVIRIGTGLENTNPEAYSLTVDAAAIEIRGAGEAGVLYGVQTLRKSLPLAGKADGIAFAPVVIDDAPRFGYRGMHLDVARHLFPVEFIKKYIDLLALHNINIFHWHLTDDQGWRIEIKKYPKLTQISSQRKETLVSHWEKPNHRYDGTPYGGFYTQDEIRDVVAYAAARHIDIIPEIDLPGHMLAVLAAYPELGCTGGPYEVGTRWGIYEDVLCAGREQTYEFLEDLFSEIVTLFPCRYVHLGGDECPKVRWKACPRCQARIREEKLADGKRSPEELLQRYMMVRIGNFLQDHGKAIIGWDEILEGGGVTDATIMSWRGAQSGVLAARTGHDAIMVPYTHLYFDYAQSLNPDEPLCIGGNVPVEKVYGYEPVPKEIAGSPELSARIIGVQANLWTEYFRDPEVVEYMVIPRIDALSEIQWTRAEHKNYADFRRRLDHMRTLYDKLGYTYATHLFE